MTVLPNFAVHKVWRGHNREYNLGTAAQKETYLEFFNLDFESKKYKQGSVFHAATLMSNHSHEVSKVTNPSLFSNHMRRHHSRYGSYFNKLSNRCGKVAQDRPHTTLLENSHHEMETVFYVHANPIRAKIVKDARNYFWSTHRLYAFGKREAWMRNIELPEWYLNLGKNSTQGQHVYRKLFNRYLAEKGATRQSFLKRRFFGSLLWCASREAAISDWRREHDSPS